MLHRTFILALFMGLPVTEGACPFGGSGDLPLGHPSVQRDQQSGYSKSEYEAALAALDLDAVKSDLKKLFVDSKSAWPADFDSYGPFFVRLAWHCSGSYRTFDGQGGCDGGRQRFDPERSWDDNTNLDKARALLLPVKLKYGTGLSWGDLFILAGTTAIESMGGPVLGFCAGRIDEPDGSESAELGPTPEQEKRFPCPVNGKCEKPLGSTTVGLIYLNPAGPMGVPDPSLSAHDVRDAFGRMAMNDSETVALIGGGHAFGKTHGACTEGAGPSPKEDPMNPWPGKCGTGKGADTFTSGFEGPWTNTPTKWSNAYFKDLLRYEWEVHTGPGGKPQWRVKNATTGDATKIMRLTSDISLIRDPKNQYQKWVRLFAEDQGAFEDAFSHAWYKLTTRDMGPVTRCMGKNVPPPQPWQFPLPDPPIQLANMTTVRAEIKKLLRVSSNILPADVFDVNGTQAPYYGALFARLAWQCSSTFRHTDYQGGCNGARLRFSPEKDWPANAALDKTLLVLKPIKDMFGDKLSWSDLIILAGTVALEDAGGISMTFCPGRTDAEDGTGSQYLMNTMLPGSNFINNNITSVEDLKFVTNSMGLTMREMTVLTGGGHCLGKKHVNRSGYSGAWTSDPTKLSNSFFTTLFTEDFEQFVVAGTSKSLQKVIGKELYYLQSDMIFRYDSELASIAQEYAADNDLFLRDFAKAWSKVVSADRFKGPMGNVCDDVLPFSAEQPTLRTSSTDATPEILI